MAERLTEPKSNVAPATFLEFFAGIRKAKRALDEATGVYRNARKRAKEGGIDMAALALLEKLSELDDDEVERRLANLVKYAAWGNVPLGSQANLFGPPEPPTEKAAAEYQAFEIEDAGYVAGKAGHKVDICAHAPGTEFYALWMRGWNRGQAWLVEHMPKHEKKSPGRKKKEGNPEDAPEKVVPMRSRKDLN